MEKNLMDGLGGMINKLSLAFGISFGKRHNVAPT
jgi:hypothetical protein